eukprot:14293566-Ditylum_brightwellii.AAC.1
MLVHPKFLSAAPSPHLQDMVHAVRTTYGDSLETYEGELCVVKIKPLSQGLGQGNGAALGTWAL